MHRVQLTSINHYGVWRAKARQLLRAGVPPDDIVWLDPAAPPDLCRADAELQAAGTDGPAGRVPQRFVRLAQAALCHSDPSRFDLL